MKLMIGENIRALRTAHGMTQEQLAAALEVSCQSVSRWELDACYPDIELLPTIAGLFDVTLDELAGLPALRSAEKQRQVYIAAQDMEWAGDLAGAITTLREALRTWPKDDGLTTELALVLGKTEHTADHREAITLLEQVLGRCTNEKLRSTARAGLCYLYLADGQREKALALGRTLPHIWESREVLLPGLVEPADRKAATDRCLNIARQVLEDVAAGRDIPFALGYAPR